MTIRQETILLYFALVCGTMSTFLLGLSGLLGWFLRSPPPSNVIYSLAAPLTIASIQSFIIRVLGRDSSRLIFWPRNALLLCSIVELFAISLYGIEVLDSMLRPVNIIVLICFALTIFQLAYSARKGDTDARIMSAGLVVSCLFVAPDVFILAGLWSRSTQFVLLQAGCGVYLVSLGLVPVRRFMETHRQLRQLSQLQAAQVATLERRNVEIQSLNEELRRQIEQRSDRMLDLLTRSRSGNVSAPVQEFAAGELLGEHYRIVRALGRGAMGSVYEVERTTDGMHLAAKLLATHSERSAMMRFVREARILAQLQHPNLVSIADIDISQDGALFLVMELVLGMTLRDAKMHYRDLQFAQSVLRQVCLGLQAIHARGFVHRDLKPANVLLSETATGFIAKIADFGISTLRKTDDDGSMSIADMAPHDTRPEKMPPALKALVDSADEGFEETVDVDDHAAQPAAAALAETGALSARSSSGIMSAELTRTGVLLGTPLYIAPELATAKHRATATADIFSLGVIAFEIFSGQLPFTVPPVIAVWQKQPLTLLPLKQVQPALSDELADLFDCCLSRDPTLRPTLDQLIAALPPPA